MAGDEKRTLVTDGGERNRGKPAPPEDMLAAPANKLNTNPHPRDVTTAIGELLDAAENVIEALDNPADYGVRQSATTAEQLNALADAIQHDELQLASDNEPRDAPAQGEQSDQSDALREAIRETRSRAQTDSGIARRLLDDLDAAESRRADQLATTLTETVGELNQHQQLKTALDSISPRQAPDQLGRDIVTQFDGLADTEPLVEAGRELETAAQEVQRCRKAQEQLESKIEMVCETASAQTSWQADTAGDVEAASQLARALEQERLWFADEATSVSGLAADVQATSDAQSKPATEFLQVFQNAHNTDDGRVKDMLREAIDAIDSTETVTARLEGVDPEALARTADRLLFDMDDHSHDVIPHLRTRVEEIKQTAERSNNADLLTLYAARQEIRYYDRTLIPQLGTQESADTETASVARRIEELDDRRSRMRQSYPSEYPDCDHTIPIYLFDLVSNLIAEADDLHQRGEHQRAAGLAEAIEQTLDWIEGLYETHSYFVLLKELRG